MSQEQNPEQTPEQEAAPTAPEANGDDNRLAELEAEVAKLKSDVLYAKAETENTRRRLEQQAEDRAKYAVTNFAKEVLSVADNLSRALQSIPAEAREGNDAVNNLVVGVEMTSRELHNSMERFHVKMVPALNNKFDPNLHQAMTEVEDTTVPTGTVVMVMQEGYTINDRLLRPALVAVSKGGPKAPQGEQVDTNV